ncbi:hypothetical protein RHECNPAF_1360097 [Rhizobium etli CNPAF512]|nr:hypothetical protein RHECNPAF_1360097 [Rhizobium etli CNPAF512]
MAAPAMRPRCRRNSSWTICSAARTSASPPQAQRYSSSAWSSRSPRSAMRCTCATERREPRDGRSLSERSEAGPAHRRAHRPIRLPGRRRALLPVAALHHGRHLAEIDGRDPARTDLRAAGQTRFFRLGDRLVWRLHGNRLCRHSQRLLEFGGDHSSRGRTLGLYRLRQWLCAVALAAARGQPAVRPADGRRPHPVPDLPLSDGPRNGEYRALQFACRHHSRACHLRPAAGDAAFPQLFRQRAGRALQGGTRRRRRLLAHLFRDHAADRRTDGGRRFDAAVHRHLERFPARPCLRRARQSADDRPAQQYRQHHDGRAHLQCEHGSDNPDRHRPACHLFPVRPLVRARHRSRRSQGVTLPCNPPSPSRI